MPLLDILRRLAVGEPAFVNPEEPTAQSATEEDAGEDGAQQGPKERPHVEIDRADHRMNGPHLEITCHIKNNSSRTIELDQIHLLGTSRELDTYLKPGEQLPFRVYEGTPPTNTNYDYCEVQFKDDTGDYFSAVHTVEFEKQPDGNYEVTDFQLVHPIKDI